jgi:hypothetical protein
MVLTLLYVGRREGLGHERTRPARNAGYEPGAREKWMRILFVHPEGNLANNPNLSAIIELLTRAGHEIILRSRRGSFARHKNPNVSVLEVRYRIQRKLMQLSCHPRKWFLGKLLITLVPPMTPPADLVVGVDRQGLIEGAVIARSKGIPLAYWSYEIFLRRSARRISRRWKEERHLLSVLRWRRMTSAHASSRRRREFPMIAFSA